jgi:hypothetical protein
MSRMLRIGAVFVTALLLSLSANADLKATRGEDYVLLHDTPCSGAALEAVRAKNPPPEYKFFNASALIENQPFKACYTIAGETVGVIFEDGDVAMIPVKAFKETSL